MGHYIKKNWLIIVGIIVLLVLYLFSRLYNLMTLPIFTDEAIYTRWTQIARNDAAWRFISLTDGKQPSFVWIGIILMKFFRNPLLATRMVSVLSGIVTMTGLYFLSFEIFKKKEIAFLTAAIYLIFPFALVYDKMALYDSLVSATIVWTIYMEIRLVRTLRLDMAFITGFVIGAAVLTKSMGFFGIYFMPFLFLLFDYKQKNLKERIIKFIGLLIVSAVIAELIYTILRLSPFYHIIDEKTSIFIYPVSEWIKHKPEDMLKDFISNFKGLFDWFQGYTTLPIIALIVASLFLKMKLTREKLLLLVWSVGPFFALAIFGRTLYPRYVLFMTMPLLPLAALSLYEILQKIKNNFLQVGAILLIMAIPLYMDFFILTDFVHAPIPKSDLGQYINGWPAGGGIKESTKFFQNKALTTPVYVATEGTFGLLPNAYEIYFVDNPNLNVKGYWPIQEKIPDEVLEKSKHMPTYFVFYQDCPSCPSQGEAPPQWNLKKIMSYSKGDSTSKLTIYQVPAIH